MPSKARNRNKKPDDDADMVQMFVRVPRKTRDGLKKLADDDERGLAMYHRRLLTQHVDEKGSGD